SVYLLVLGIRSSRDETARVTGAASGGGAMTRPPKATAAISPPVNHFLRPRLTAVAASEAGVGAHAGGWLFDQALAGWDVTVITADNADPMPLRILGARGRDMTILGAQPAIGACLQAIAVRDDLYESDARVRAMVAAAAAAGGAEVRLWGASRPAGDAVVAHELSLAARAFKARALSVLGEPALDAGDPAGLEIFRCG